MEATRSIHLTVNGTVYERTAPVRMTLADFLREELNLTGTHLGCEHGVCGACTILYNGATVRSCLMLAVQADGAELMTVEGLAQGDTLHPLQQAFQDHHALQCGFCTPGLLMTAYALLLQETPHPQQRRGSGRPSPGIPVVAPAMPPSYRRLQASVCSRGRQKDRRGLCGVAGECQALLSGAGQEAGKNRRSDFPHKEGQCAIMLWQHA